MTKRIYADIILLGITAIWGTTFVVVQKAIEELPPFSFLFVRFGLAFLFLLIFTLFRSPTKTNEMRSSLFKDKSLLIAGGALAIWLFAGYAFQTLGLIYTTSSKAGFITGLSVVLVPLFSFFLLKLRPKAASIIGVLFASIGLYLLAFGDSSTQLTGDAILNKGDLLVLFCAIGFALQIVLTGRYAVKYDALSLTLVQLGFVSLLNLIFAIKYEDVSLLLSKEILFNPYMIFALVLTSLFATALAFLAQTHFQRFTTPTRVALIFAMEPIFAAITGVWAADEVLTGPVLLGCVFIFLGMVCAELPSNILLKPLRIFKR